jgi:hypothetical protein
VFLLPIPSPRCPYKKAPTGLVACPATKSPIDNTYPQSPASGGAKTNGHTKAATVAVRR